MSSGAKKCRVESSDFCPSVKDIWTMASNNQPENDTTDIPGPQLAQDPRSTSWFNFYSESKENKEGKGGAHVPPASSRAEDEPTVQTALRKPVRRVTIEAPEDVTDETNKRGRDSYKNPEPFPWPLHSFWPNTSEPGLRGEQGLPAGFTPISHHVRLLPSSAPSAAPLNPAESPVIPPQMHSNSHGLESSTASSVAEFEKFMAPSNLYMEAQHRDVGVATPVATPMDLPAPSTPLPPSQSPYAIPFSYGSPGYSMFPVPAQQPVVPGSYPSHLTSPSREPLYPVSPAPSFMSSQPPNIFDIPNQQSMTSVPFAAVEENWPDLLKHCKESDETMIAKWDDEINSLLVFAGLFSAVVTAFVIESYQLLQPDQEELTVSALASISTQLQILIVGNGAAPKFEITRWDTDASAVALNALWFLSLIASLTSAFFGILLKQAFREYKSWTGVPRTLEALRLRQLRFDAFTAWHVAGLVAALPALLEVAVLLFMIGLPIFLWDTNLALSIAITATVGLFSLISVTSITLGPAFSQNFPLKSPVAWGFWKMISTLARLPQMWDLRKEPSLPSTRPSREKMTRILLDREDSKTLSNTWRQRDLRLSLINERSHLWSLLKWFCSSWNDHRLAASVRQCALDLIYSRQPNYYSPRTYLDIIKIGIPDMMGLTDSLWPSIAAKCNLPQEVLSQTFSDAGDGKIEGQDPAQLLSRMPWKILAVISDELIACLRLAIRDNFQAAIYDNQDPRRVAALSGLCLLECIFEHASAAGFSEPYTEAWITLFCDICAHSQATALPHLSENPDTHQSWTLEDIVFPWFEHRRLDSLSRDNTLRMLFTADIVFASMSDDTKSHDKSFDRQKYRLRMFSLLTSRAFKIIIKAGWQEDDTVQTAVLRACRSIENAIQLSIDKQITNCGLDEFPWLKEMPSFASDFSSRCRVLLATGFETGVFKSNDTSSQAILLRALIIQSKTEGPERSRVQADGNLQSILKPSRPEDAANTAPAEAANQFSPYIRPYYLRSPHVSPFISPSTLVLRPGPFPDSSHTLSSEMPSRRETPFSPPLPSPPTPYPRPDRFSGSSNPLSSEMPSGRGTPVIPPADIPPTPYLRPNPFPGRPHPSHFTPGSHPYPRYFTPGSHSYPRSFPPGPWFYNFTRAHSPMTASESSNNLGHNGIAQSKGQGDAGDVTNNVESPEWGYMKSEQRGGDHTPELPGQGWDPDNIMSADSEAKEVPVVKAKNSSTGTKDVTAHSSSAPSVSPLPPSSSRSPSRTDIEQAGSTTQHEHVQLPASAGLLPSDSSDPPLSTSPEPIGSTLQEGRESPEGRPLDEPTGSTPPFASMS